MPTVVADINPQVRLPVPARAYYGKAVYSEFCVGVDSLAADPAHPFSAHCSKKNSTPMIIQEPQLAFAEGADMDNAISLYAHPV